MLTSQGRTCLCVSWRCWTGSPQLADSLWLQYYRTRNFRTSQPKSQSWIFGRGIWKSEFDLRSQAEGRAVCDLVSQGQCWSYTKMPFPSLCKVLFMIKPEDRERLETELKINRKKVLCCCEKCMAKFNFDEDTMLHDRVLNLENPGWLTKKTGKNHGCWKCYDWSDLLLMMQQQLEGDVLSC